MTDANKENVNVAELDWTFNAEDVKQLSINQTLAPGLHQFMIEAAEAQISKNSGKPMLKLRCTPLARKDDPTSADSMNALNFFLVLPLRNPLNPADQDMSSEAIKKRQDTARMAENNLRAILGPEVIPHRPRKNAEGAYEFAGKPLPPKGYDRALETINETVMRESVALLKNNGQTINDFAFFGEVGHEEWEGRVRATIKRMHAEIPVKDGVPMQLVDEKARLVMETDLDMTKVKRSN